MKLVFQKPQPGFRKGLKLREKVRPPLREGLKNEKTLRIHISSLGLEKRNIHAKNNVSSWPYSLDRWAHRRNAERSTLNRDFNLLGQLMYTNDGSLKITYFRNIHNYHVPLV